MMPERTCADYYNTWTLRMRNYCSLVLCLKAYSMHQGVKAYSMHQGVKAYKLIHSSEKALGDYINFHVHCCLISLAK